MESILDLRAEPGTRVQTAAFYAIKDLRRGESLVVLTAEDPALVMASIDLQLRGIIASASAPTAEGWRTEVRRREDAAPTGIVDLLTRDHRRLDELFAVALRRVNAGDLAGARPLVEAFASGIRRHVATENDVLAPALPHPAGPDGAGHVEIMLREHDEILRQLAEVEALFGGAEAPEAWEVEPFVAILSGTLAKHEYREEANLFPVWEAAIARLPEPVRTALEDGAAARLAGV
jgi:hemerythrin-like domain-containing protein